MLISNNNKTAIVYRGHALTLKVGGMQKIHQLLGYGIYLAYKKILFSEKVKAIVFSPPFACGP